MTGIYRGKVSHNHPWEYRDGQWHPLSDQPYPCVIFGATAGPEWDHVGMPVLVVANPDQGDDTSRPYWTEDDGLPVLAIPGDSYRFVEMPDVAATALLDLIRALRATLAQRDEAHARVERLQASERQARSVIALHQQNGCGVQLMHEGRALASPPTAPDPTENPDA